MTLRYAIRALRKHWWTVALCAVVGTLLSVVLVQRATPIYEGTVTFFARTPSSESDPLQGDQFGRQRVNSYVKLLGSQRLADRVVDQADLDVDSVDLMKQITGTADLNTVLMTAHVRDSSPERVETVVEAVAEEFPKLVRDIEGVGGDSVTPVQLEVVSGPLVKPYPVSPVKRLWVGLGLLLGGLLGTSLALLRALADRTVRTEETLREVGRVPVLGRLPVDNTATKARILTKHDSTPARLEAFRKLRTNLQFVDAEKPVSVIAVTSSVPEEGKTSTAANLATSFAEAGRSVLLIDADLRRPTLAAMFHLETSVGLTNVLAGQVALADVLQPAETPGLYVLASGPTPPNPSELLGGESMLELLRQAKAAYDLVVVDTAPLLPVTDGAVTAARADGALLVVRYGRTKMLEVERAVDMLRAIDARILGTVLNRIPTRGGERESYDSYSYHSQQTPPRRPGVSGTPPVNGTAAARKRRKAGAQSPARSSVPRSDRP